MQQTLDQISISRGAAKSWTITLTDDTGTAISYDGTETLSATIWSGEDQASVATPTVTWTTPSSGVLTLTVTSTDSDLDEGNYRIRVLLSDTDTLAWEGYLQVTSSPGSTTALKTYCSYQDLLNFYPQIEKFEHPALATNFMHQRHQTRVWLDRTIQAHWGSRGSWLEDIYNVAFSPNFYTDGRTDPTLQNYLDNDQLKITATVVEMCAKRTLGTILLAVSGPNSVEGKLELMYRRQGEQFVQESTGLVNSYVAEILDTAGVNTLYTINCSFTTIRRY